MNEVTDLLDAIWPDPPEPTEESWTRARQRLTDAMRAEELAAPPTAQVVAQLDRQRVGRVHRIARDRRFWAAVAAVAVLTVAVSLVLPGSPSRPTSAAAAELQKMARLAASAPRVVPGPGQYLYLETHTSSLVGQESPRGSRMVWAWVGQGSTIETWVNSEGLGREVQTPDSTVQWLTPGAEAGWAPHRQQLRAECEARNAGKCTNLFLFPGSSGPYVGAWSSNSNLTYPANQSLPTDPAALKRAILSWDKSHPYDGAGVPIGEQLFGAIEYDLQAGASPKLVSAIYQMISDLPGVKLLGPMTDTQGRSGVGVAYTDTNGDGRQEQLIFDPKTAALLEFRIVQVGRETRKIPFPPIPSAPPAGLRRTPPIGTVVSETTFEATSVVDSLPPRAAAPNMPWLAYP